MEDNSEPKTVAEVFNASFPEEIFVIRRARHKTFGKPDNKTNDLFDYVVCLTQEDCIEYMHNSPYTDITICQPVQQVKITQKTIMEKV